MANKNSRKRRASESAPGGAVRIALALGPAVWHVGVGYGKGHLSGSHYLFVTVCHKPSGRERCESWTATSKASARRDAAEAARRLARELAGGSS